MGQPQPKLKISNNAPRVVICHITDFEKKPIQQAIAPNATFTLETSRGYHTISVYPLGTTSVHGIKAEAHYDLDLKLGDVQMDINARDGFLNISMPIGNFEKCYMPDSICNQTDEALLVVVTSKDEKFFEQLLLKNDSYQFYALDGRMNVSVFKPREKTFLTTYSFIGERTTFGYRCSFSHHWEATITKVENIVNIGVVRVFDSVNGSYLHF